MMHLSLLIVLSLLILTACSSIQYKDITINEAKEKTGQTQFIDIRTLEEFRQGHIPGAINIDYYSKNFKEKLNQLEKDKEYIIYCRSGSRSSHSLKTFKELGFNKISHMKDGFLNWDGDVER